MAEKIINLQQTPKLWHQKTTSDDCRHAYPKNFIAYQELSQMMKTII